MRLFAVPLVAILCLCSGCLTAARKVEQAIRRDQERPAAKKPAKVEDLKIAVRPSHPRLFVTVDWPDAVDEISRDWQARLRRRADDSLDLKAIRYSPDKLLVGSREALRRLSLLGGVYRFTHDAKYAEAGRREMLNVCSFADWNPDDFLATSEMMTAVSIGYDWLHDTLSTADRKTIADAIVRLGLKPALTAYETHNGWTLARHNWNCVCNGGVIVGALAIAEEQPEIARRALNFAMASIQTGLGAFDAAGGTGEGPMYQHYASRYLTFAAAALATAPEQPVDFKGDTGWKKAGDFRLAMTGPLGRVANFGDGAETLGNSAWMLWHATAFKRPDYAAFQIAADRKDPSIFDLLWYTPGGSLQNKWSFTAALPTVNIFDSAQTIRSAENDPNATFVAMRIGSNLDNHSHLDLGNFVLDMSGQRFASDLGADNYDLPGYLHGGRPDYLRTSTPGHNTLTIGDASQPLDATAQAIFMPEGDGKLRANLTTGYPGAKSVDRTIALDGRAVAVTDVIRVSRQATFIWNLHTAAKVTENKAGLELEIEGKRVQLRVLEPDGASISVEPDATRPPQNPVEGMTHIRIRVRVNGEATIKVQFRPID